MNSPDYNNYFNLQPDRNGRYGKYGGTYLPPDLEKIMAEIRDAYDIISRSAKFISELRAIRKHFQGRPTPVYHAERLSRHLGAAQIYLKREDLNHTGAHKLNHCMGEGLLATYLGKKKLIAETGAGQHGVALATAAADFGLECDIHMGEVDIAKQAPNVARMMLLGANVIPVTFGLKTLKEAVDSCFQAYMADPVTQIYCIGSVVGPHPFPMMVRDFQRVVGIEAREQFYDMTGDIPDIVTACVGGGSSAMGIFSASSPTLRNPRRGTPRPRPRSGRQRRQHDLRQGRRAARLQLLPPARRQRRTPSRLFHCLRPRLPRRRPRTRLPQG